MDRRVLYEPTFATLRNLLGTLAKGHRTDAGELIATVELAQDELRQAMRDGAADDAAIAKDLLTKWDGQATVEVLSSPISGTASQLSAREVEVLRRLAEGLANKQIALELGISARTVRNHVSRVYEKLGVSARAEAAVQAVRMGLLQP